MNLSTVKSIAVPEGNVMALSIGGIKAWAVPQAAASPWDEVAAAIADGTYKTKYKIGDMVPLDLGSEGLINMQIAAFDADILADGSGTAAISWVAKELLATSLRMNPGITGSAGAYTEGTGAIGGWEKCELRAYLQNTIKPLIPASVTSVILPVKKTHDAYDSTVTMFEQTTFDELFVPAKGEVNGGNYIYKQLFPSASYKKKCKSGQTSFDNWWVRDANNGTRFRTVNTSGMMSYLVASNSCGVCLGFCTGRTPT